MSSTGIDRKGILAERVAVVTGSTSGIGFAIARRLAQDGAHVVISSRKQQNVDRAVAQLQREGLSVAGIVCHVGKAEDRERLVATALEHCGGVEFLVCCAGVNPLVGSMLGTSEQIWDKILNVNCEVPSPAAEPVAALHGEEELGVYNVSKTALLALTRTLALELAPKDIRVNCLVPGVIKTDFSKVVRIGYVGMSLSSSTSGSIIRCRGKFGEPEDCAGVVSFLCSPDASYITGENIAVAGFSSRL
ncbi:hypothetical protein H8959_016977 [Pygathrix nigripes]